MNEVLMLPESQKKVLAYIESTGKLIAAAEKKASLDKDTQTKVAALIPQAVDSLISNNRVEEKYSEKLASLLTDPVSALEILISTANHRNVEESPLGDSVQSEKRAYANNSDSPFCGMKTASERESDRVFKERILGSFN